MNEPTTTKPLYRRLTYQQVIEEIEDRKPEIYVIAPFGHDDRARYVRANAGEYDGILSILSSDPDKESVESFFYLDHDLDLILDPFNEP